MQCNVEGMACIAVYIRVDRRAQCDDVLLTACACARFHPKSRPLSASALPRARQALTAPPPAPKSTNTLQIAGPSRQLKHNLYHVTTHVPTRVCAKPLGSSALWKPHLLLQAGFPICNTHPIWHKHGMAKCNGGSLLARSSY